MWWLAGRGRRCWRSQRRWPTACWELVCLLLPAESMCYCSCLPCDTGVRQAGPSGAHQVAAACREPTLLPASPPQAAKPLTSLSGSSTLLTAVIMSAPLSWVLAGRVQQC